MQGRGRGTHRPGVSCILILSPGCTCKTPGALPKCPPQTEPTGRLNDLYQLSWAPGPVRLRAALCCLPSQEDPGLDLIPPLKSCVAWASCLISLDIHLLTHDLGEAGLCACWADRSPWLTHRRCCKQQPAREGHREELAEDRERGGLGQ